MARVRLIVTLAVAAAVAVFAGGAIAKRPTGVVETCAHRSFAEFPHAFSSADNLVVGPFVLVGGGRLTAAETVRRFGGNKFPALLAAGHRVTVELSKTTRRTASLGYGPLPQNRELRVPDGHRVVTFRSCRRPARHDTSSVTFWSGFVLASRPQCVHLRVWVDDERKPRRARLPLGKRCRL
jgi:hypothetical protein